MCGLSAAECCAKQAEVCAALSCRIVYGVELWDCVQPAVACYSQWRSVPKKAALCAISSCRVVCRVELLKHLFSGSVLCYML